MVCALWTMFCGLHTMVCASCWSTRIVPGDLDTMDVKVRGSWLLVRVCVLLDWAYVLLLVRSDSVSLFKTMFVRLRSAIVLPVVLLCGHDSYVTNLDLFEATRVPVVLLLVSIVGVLPICGTRNTCRRTCENCCIVERANARLLAVETGSTRNRRVFEYTWLD